MTSTSTHQDGRGSVATTLWPPGPDTPVDVARMREDPLGLVTDLASTYGDVTSHELFGQRVVMAHHPDVVKQVLRTNGANYTKRGTPDEAMLRPLLGNGLLTSNGEDWERQRHLNAPAFRPARILTYDDAVTQAASQLLQRCALASRSGEVLMMDHHLTSLTLTILIRVVQGSEVGDVGTGFGEAVDAINRFIGEPVREHGPKAVERLRAYRQAKRFLDMVTDALIEAGRSRGTPGEDLLSHMLAADHVSSDTDLRDQVLTLIMAGHETTAKALTWALHLLHSHPDMAAQVAAEALDVHRNRVPTAADYPNLPLCTQVISESLRLFPPVWMISRRAIAPDQLGGYLVPAGTMVSISPWVLHHDSRFHPEPENFRPSRFSPDSPPPAPFSYLPFGGGSRICIGKHLALFEATLVLSMLVKQFRFVETPQAHVEPEALVTMRPRHGLPMTVRER